MKARDPRFDGRFVTAVKTTGIYCRPICPARIPRRDNVRFLPSAAAAEAAGFRACRRCAPDRAVWAAARAGDELVARALRILDGHAGDELRSPALAARCGVSVRQLDRAFAEVLGTTPGRVARSRRLHFAKHLLETTDRSVTEIAFASGFGSLRRFHAAFRETFDATPSRVRGSGSGGRPDGSDWIELRLPEPRGAGLVPVFEFLAAHAVPGVERFEALRLRRVLRFADDFAGVEIDAADPEAPRVRLHPSAFARARPVVQAATTVLGLLAPCEAMPQFTGLAPERVPGAFEPFELAVRTVLGQQVSVAAGNTWAARLAELAGPRVEIAGFPDLDRAFPGPEELLDADLEALGLTSARVTALRALATAVVDGAVDLSSGTDPRAARQALLALPGFGPWTVELIAMRALGDPDAFPANDLVLRKALAAPGEPPLPAREVERRAEAWRPWRAHACLALWRSAYSFPPVPGEPPTR